MDLMLPCSKMFQKQVQTTSGVFTIAVTAPPNYPHLPSISQIEADPGTISFQVTLNVDILNRDREKSQTSSTGFGIRHSVSEDPKKSRPTKAAKGNRQPVGSKGSRKTVVPKETRAFVCTKRTGQSTIGPIATSTSSVAGHSKTLQSHRNNSHRKSRIFPCETCGKPLKWKSGTRMCGYSHMNWYELERSKVFHQRCYFCKKIFVSSKVMYERHLLTHIGEKPMNCHKCKKRFTTSSTLATHIRKHSGVKRFRCSKCGRIFHTRSALYRHALVHLTKKQNMQAKRYECTICLRKFLYRSGLQRHLSIHKKI